MTFRWLEVTLSYCRRERRLRPRRFERGGSIARVGVCAMPFRSKLALRQRAQQRRFRFPMAVLLMWWWCVLAGTTICVSYRKCNLPGRTLAGACNTTQYVLYCRAEHSSKCNHMSWSRFGWYSNRNRQSFARYHHDYSRLATTVTRWLASSLTHRR